MIEAQQRVRTLAVEASRKRDLDVDLAREKLRVVEAERARQEEQQRVSELIHMNESLLEELGKKKTTTPLATPEVAPRENQVSSSMYVARLEQELELVKSQLSDARAVAQHSQMALQSVASAPSVSAEQQQLRARRNADAAVLKAELERQNAEVNILRQRLKNAEDVQQENERLRVRVSELEVASAKRGYLEESEKNTLRLREENNSLKQKVSRLQTVATKLVKTEAELEKLQSQTAKWKVLVSSEYPSLEHVQELVQSLNGQIQTLQFEKSSAEEKAAVLKAEVEEIKGVVASLNRSRERDAEQARIKDQQMDRLQMENSLLKEQLASNQLILESYNKEGSTFTNYDSVKSNRIVQLESTLAQQTAFVEKLQADLKKMEQANSALSSDLDATRDRMFTMESRLTQGEFNPDTVRVVHMRQNPLNADADEKSKRIAELTGEVDVLRKRLTQMKSTLSSTSGAAVSSAELDSLKKDNINLAKRLERLKQVAQSKIEEFREIVVRLFGYKINIEFDAHTYTLTPVGAHPDNQLKFKSNPASGALELLETDFAMSLPESVSQYLRDHGSVPAFLGAIILQSLD